ncbi:c-type cytochrome [Chachezhania antarctica]|uniref:c-type cytochrome n=1 Tax=Chachezhania antarctica TaxID=2340860 RepID=UPI000EACFD95|nr:cytochrome c [Chachezhania antarctica]|tara:strand:+ start:4812 stop:5708 length:897 start_codon:yes stop_codon:yes gene_type:complete
MRRLLIICVALALAGAAVFLVLTRPATLPAAELAELDGLSGDATRGETVFWAGGCASCHAAPEAEGDDLLVLTGGERLASPFGTFIAPNISPDPTHGIGDWTRADLANALTRGTDPAGRHLYPAFPYTSYIHMELQDIADLDTFLRTLPADATPNEPHEISFPFTIRRGLGLWNMLYLTEDWAIPGDLPEARTRGRYLVEGPGHCSECHTPRGPIGGLERGQWLTGAENPTGDGRIPGLTPGQLDWSAEDIAYYLETGFTPDFDSAGGHMAKVVTNLSHLAPEDRAAIAAYLKALPAQ